MRKIRSEEPANQSIYEDSQKDTANLKIKNVKTLDELNKMQDSVDKQDTGAIKIQDDIHQLNNGLEKAKANEL
jgi:predicted  nucleic acid-binding Zn-ribbon protein